MSPHTLSVSLLTSVLSLSALIPVASASSFSDVASTHPNAEAIEYVKAEGIVHGYPDGTFKPNQTINRAEFTKIIMNGYNSLESVPAQCGVSNEMHLPFSDVHQGDWFAFRVCIAVASSIVTGYPDGTFRPGAQINLSEASKILVKSFNFSSVETNVWYEGYVRALSSRNSIPTSVTSFDHRLTRGEMAEMIWRLKAGITTKPSRTYEDLAPKDSAQTSDQYDFVLRYLHETGQGGTQETWTDDSWEGSIVRRDRQTGKETVVVQSIKQLLPALRDRDNHTLFPFAQPSDELVIFQGVWAETDSGGGPLYAFDTTKKTLRAMNVNTVPTQASFELGKDTKGLSSDESKLLWVPDSDPKGHERVMYLSDLVNDSSRVLVQLQGNETFDAADFAGGIGSQYTDVSWTNDHTVRYAVYDQSKKPASSYDGKNILIEYRTVQVP